MSEIVGNRPQASASLKDVRQEFDNSDKHLQTFEEIKEKTGNSESDVIKIMRKNLKPGSFRLWRKRVHNTSIKHRKKFKLERKKMREKIKISDMY